MDQLLRDGVVRGGRDRFQPPRQLGLPCLRLGNEGSNERFQQDERADARRVPQGELDRHRPAVAAADHDRGAGTQGAEQGRSIIDMGPDARRKGPWSLAAGAPSAVVDDDAPQRGEYGDRLAPEHGGRSGSVDPQDRGAASLLLVVQTYAVGFDLRHRFNPRIGRRVPACSTTVPRARIGLRPVRIRTRVQPLEVRRREQCLGVRDR